MTENANRSTEVRLANVYYATTEIADVDRRNGSLSYRGFPITELTQKREFEDVAYLLIHGSMPSDQASKSFKRSIASSRVLPRTAIEMIRQTKALPPVVVLRTITPLLAANGDGGSFDECSLIALLPSIITAYDALRMGVDIPRPDNNLDLASDFLTRLLRRPISELERRIINLVFILQAEQGANTSSFVARIAASTDSDVCAVVSAAIATFAGHRHGAAAACGLGLLEQVGSVREARSLAKNWRSSANPDSGINEIVSDIKDPRTSLLRQAASDLGESSGDLKLLKTVDAFADQLAEIGHRPIAELYAEIVYRLLGVPADLGVSLSAVARCAGWIAHIREQRANNILIRPRLVYENVPRAPSLTGKLS